MHTENFYYQDGDTQCHGFIAYDDNYGHAMPAVLVAHDWSGCNEFAREKARQLAGLGYVGIAIDMYGEGRTGETNDEKSALMAPLAGDRQLLRQRILAAFHAVAEHDSVDQNRIAAIGFCFGGLCALDLARSGVDVSGVVSFHGLFTAPEGVSQEPIKAKVLALHGYDDPMVSTEQMLAFTEEMTQAGVDWQLHAYGKVMHAFTNPQANDPAFGTVYNEVAAKRSWQAAKNFFAELFESQPRMQGAKHPE